jgi:hypothetical protein
MCWRSWIGSWARPPDGGTGRGSLEEFKTDLIPWLWFPGAQWPDAWWDAVRVRAGEAGPEYTADGVFFVLDRQSWLRCQARGIWSW